MQKRTEKMPLTVQSIVMECGGLRENVTARCDKLTALVGSLDEPQTGRLFGL